jgi:hypothetical protein
VLDGLWIASAAPAIVAALASMAASDPIAIVASPRLARALTSRGHRVTLVGSGNVGDGTVIATLPSTAQFGAVIGVGVGELAEWQATVGAWAAAAVDGGGVVMVDRGPAIELSRRALCAGLTALEQRVAGRWIVTSGLVSRL